MEIPMRNSFPLVALSAAILMLSAAASLASRAAADACATRLAPDAKLVYGAVISSVAPGTDLVELVRSKTRGLVMAGKLDRAQAQPAAQAAGACLKQAL
jgi:hypothetical protein